MSKDQAVLRGLTERDSRDCDFAVADIVRYLSGVASLQEDNRTGNMQLGRALQLLSDGLKPYGYLEIAELLELLEKLIVKSDAVRKRAIQSETVMAHDLRSMSQEDVQAILDQEYFTKKQLVELGSERFGISRGKLIRLRKKDALESIRGALEHEKSLDVISIEARRAGKRGLAKL